MSNSYYNHTTYPTPNSPGSSATLRLELESITTGFSLLPTLASNGYKVAMVNSAGTALTASAALQSLAITSSSIDSTPVGATTASTGRFAGLIVSSGAASLGSSVTIAGGVMNNTIIGGTTPAAGAFTTLSASSGFTGTLVGNVTGNLTGNVTGNVAGNLTGNVVSSGTSTFAAITMSGAIAMGTSKITGLGEPTLAQDAATKNYTDTGLALKLSLTGGTMSGAIAMGTSKITGVGDPTAAQDVATKSYVDTVSQGLDAKASCRVATTANITLSGAQTIDGIAVVAGDRVLVKDQTITANNGIYLCAASTWTRTTDADAWTELPAAFVFVEVGTLNANNGYVCTVASGGTLGTTAITWTQFSGAGQITAGLGLTKTGNTIDVGTASSSRIVVNANDIDLATTGVSAATYQSMTVDTYGRVTAGTNPTTLAGYNISNAYTTTQIDTALALKLNLSGGTMSGAIAMGTSKITGMGDPTTNQDAATKIYVDGILGSATAAATSATAAATSATNAASSASSASGSSVSAGTSATNAAASETSALASSTSAGTSATNAGTSATNAAASAASASTSAGTATTQASNASTSATTASTQATSATSSASTATTQASNASTSATAAAASAASASSSATSATGSASTATTQASNASTSATNAAASASAAATSATAAAAAAASGLYRQVLDKSANYTIIAADQGTLFRVTTTTGTITLTLPLISNVTDGFKVSTVKWTGDANVVTIAASGSDTINGGASSTLGAQYTQTTFVADFETNQWFAATSGLGTTNVTVDVFTGNSSTTAFTLSGDPGNKYNTDVYFSGVHQDHSSYNQSAAVLTFSTAPPTGTSNIEVVWTQPLSIGVAADNTVTTAKLVDANVTTAKIANLSITTAKLVDANVTTAKIADANVTAAKLASTSVTPGSYTTANITVDAQGRLTAATSGSGGVTSVTTSSGLSTNTAATGAVSITNTGVTSAVAGTGIAVSGATGAVTFTNNGVTALTTSSGLSTNTSATGAVSVTNTGVTSIVAGTGITVSGATGAVTVNATGGGTVTSIATGNGLQGGTITTSGTLSLAAPSFNTVGSYVWGSLFGSAGVYSVASGSNWAAGTGNQLVRSSLYPNIVHSNNLSGTWKWMGAPVDIGNVCGYIQYGYAVMVRVS